MGLILAEVLLGYNLWSNQDFKSTIRKIISLVTESNVFREIARQCGKLDLYEVNYIVPTLFLVRGDDFIYDYLFIFNLTS